MEMLRPGAEHQRLYSRLQGHCSGAEQLAPSPWGEGGSAIGRTHCRIGPDRMALECTEEKARYRRGSGAGRHRFPIESGFPGQPGFTEFMRGDYRRE